jgi:hypothetical protein
VHYDWLQCRMSRNRLFDMAANRHADINPADSLSILANIATSVVGNEVAWNYMVENWDIVPL